MGCGENGQQAIEMCRQWKPDVALLDIRMPIMDGIEAAQIVLKEELAAPLLLTTFDEQDLILRALKSGVNGYILKKQPCRQDIGGYTCGGSARYSLSERYFRLHSKSDEDEPKADIFTELTERAI